MKIERRKLPLERVDTKQGRRYKLGNEFELISISTLANYFQPPWGILAWKKKLIKDHGEEEARRLMKLPAQRGTRLHKAIETNSSERLLEDDLSFFENWIDYQKKANFQILEQELPVYFLERDPLTQQWLNRGYAGTLDALIEEDGKYYLSDFKCSDKPKRAEYTGNYWLQLALYAEALKFSYKVQVDGIRIYNLTPDKIFLFESEPEELTWMQKEARNICEAYYDGLDYPWDDYVKTNPIIQRYKG